MDTLRRWLLNLLRDDIELIVQTALVDSVCCCCTPADAR